MNGGQHNMSEHGRKNRYVQQLSDSIPQLAELARIMGDRHAKGAKAASTPNGRVYVAFTLEQVHLLHDILQFSHLVCREHILANKFLEEERRSRPWSESDHLNWLRDHPDSRPGRPR